MYSLRTCIQSIKDQASIFWVLYAWHNAFIIFCDWSETVSVSKRLVLQSLGFATAFSGFTLVF